MGSDSLSRRKFLASGGAAAAGLALGVEASGQRRSEERRNVRCGFVGVGNRGSTLLRSVVQIPGVKVAGICDVDEAHRERAVGVVEGAGGGRPETFEEWTKILEREDIEAIVSALPCDLHYPLYRDALAAGKHLYGEKPMCLTVAHADDLVARAKRSGRVFQIGFQRRFDGRYRVSIEAYRSGIIGKPFDGRGVRYGSGGPFRRPGEWFSFRARSGDWMLEQAVHHWDGLTWALGKLPLGAHGTGRQDIFREWDPKRDVSDYYTAIIKYPDGLTFTWTHTWASPPHSHFGGMHEQLVGPRGAIDLGAGLIAFRRGASPDGRSTRRLELPETGTGDRTTDALTDFFHCVRTGRAPRVGVEDGRNATLIGLLVREAVYRERTVTLEEVLAKKV